MENDALRKARVYGLRFLSVRPRSKKEFKDRLRQKDFPCEIVEAIIDEFASRGFLNDANFARLWISSRLAHNPKGFYIIKSELRQKGIDESIIDEAIQEARSKTDEKDIALEIAKQKFARFSGLDREKSRHRIYDFLNRRGFPANTIYDVLKELYGSQKNMDD